MLKSNQRKMSLKGKRKNMHLLITEIFLKCTFKMAENLEDSNVTRTLFKFQTKKNAKNTRKRLSPSSSF